MYNYRGNTSDSNNPSTITGHVIVDSMPSVTLTPGTVEIGVVTVSNNFALESTLETSNTKLNTINTSVGITNTKLDTVNTNIGTSNTKLDTVNTNIGTSNTKLDTVNTNIGTTNTTLGTTNTKLDTINTSVGSVDTSVGTVNTTLGTTNTKLDTINTSVGTVNTSVGTVDTTLGITNTKLDTVNTNIGTTNTTLGTTNTKLDTINTSVGDVNTSVGTVNTSIGTTNTTLGTTNTKLDTINTSVGTVNTTLSTLILGQGSVTTGQSGSLAQGAVTTAAPTYTTGNTNPLSLTTTGALRVDNSSVTQPVSGTVAISNSFALDATLGTTNTKLDTINTSVGTVNTSVGTVNTSVGTVNTTLGTTNTKLDTINTSVGTVNTTLGTLILGQGSVTTGQSGSLSQGAVTTSAPTYTTGNTNPLSLTTTGALRVDNSSVTQPVSGTVAISNSFALDATLGTTNTKLDTINTSVGTVNTSVGTVNTSVGTVNTTLGTTNTKLDTINTSIGTVNTSVGTVNTSVGTVNTTLGTTNTKLDTINTSVGTVNTTLGTLILGQGSTTTGQSGSLSQGAVTTAAPTYTTGNTNPLSLTTTGALRVDNSAVTQPVSGTIAVSNSFALDTTLGTTNTKLDTINTSVGTVNTSVGTVNTSIGTVNTTLGTTNAKLDTINTSIGTVNTSVGTVNTTLGTLILGQGSTTTGQSGSLSQGAVTTAAPTYITGNTNPLSLTTVGALRVDNSAVTQPVSGTIAVSNSFALDTTLGTTNTKLDTINTSVGTVNTSVGTVNTSVGTVNTTLGITNTKLDTINTSIGTVNTSVGTVNTTLGTLILGQGSATTGQSGCLSQGAVTTAAPTYTTGNTNPLSLTTTGALRVDNSAVTQPVSGTIAVSNSFALDTTLGTTNTKLDTINTSIGTVNTNVGTVNTSVGTVNTTLGTLILGQGSTTTGQSGSLVQGAVTTAAPTYTTGNTNPLSLTTTGALRVDNSAVTQPVSGTIAVSNSFALDTTLGTTNTKLDTINTSVGTVNTSVGTVNTSVGTVNTTLGTTNTKLDTINTSVGTVNTTLGTLILGQGSTTTGQSGSLSQGAVTTAAPTYTTGNTNPLSLTTAGALRVDNSAVTQPVSGTIAVSNSFALDTTLGTTNTKLDTINTSVGTVNTTLGTTNTKLDTINTSIGTVNTSVGTVNTTLGTLILGQGSTTAGQSGSLAQGAVTTAAPTYTTGNTNPLSLTTVGALRVDNSAVTQPVSGTIAVSNSFALDATLGTTNTKLDTINTSVGTVNTSVGTVNTSVGTVNTTLGTTNTKLDTINTSVGTVNTTLGTLILGQGSTTTGQSGSLSQGAVTTAAPTYTTGNTNPLSLTTTGALRVDNSAVTQPVSGTIAVSNNFALDATLGTTNTKLDTINTSIGTVNTSVGTVNTTLGTTNTKLDTINTSVGTVNTSVGTVNTTLGTLILGQGSTTTGQSGSLSQGAVTTAAPTYTTGNTNPLSLTTAGALRVDNSAVTQPVSGTIAVSNSFALDATLGTTNTKLDTINTSVGTVNTSVGTVNTSVGTVNTTLGTTNTKLDTINTSIGTVNTSVGTVNTSIGTVNTSVGTVNTTLGTLILGQGSTTTGQSGSLSQGAVTTAAPTYTTGNTNPLSLTTAGALRVDNSAVTQPISGTIAVSNSFALDATLSSTNTKLDTINTSIGTVNTSVGTVNTTLGTTNTKLDTINTSVGTVNTSVGTVNTTLGTLILGQGSTTTGQSGSLSQGAVTTAAPTYITGNTNPLSLTTVGALRVDNSAVTQPVSGTIAVSNSFALDTTLGTTNTKLDTINTSVGTVNTSVGTVNTTLGTTNTKLDTINTSIGTVNTSVGTVNTTLGTLILGQGSTTTGQSGALSQGAVTTAAPTYTTGNTNPLSLTIAGALRVDNSAVTQPVSGTVAISNSFALDATLNSTNTKLDTINTSIGTVNTSIGTVNTSIGTVNTSVGTVNTTLGTLILGQGSTTSGQLGSLSQGAVTTAAPTYTTGKTNPLSLTTNGELRIVNENISSTGNTSTNNIGGTTTLNGTITNSATTITLTSAAQFPSSGTIKIDSEYISYTAISVNDITGCTRGAFNSTAATHTSGTSVIGVFIGTAELNIKSDVMVSLTTNITGTEYFDFSNDGTIWSAYPTTGFAISSNIQEFHIAVKGNRYFRVRFETSSASQSTSFAIYTYYGTFSQGKLPLNQTITSDSDSIITRSIISGQTDGGSYLNATMSSIGHLECAIREPMLPFGSLHTENIFPIFQSDAIYGLNDGQVISFSTGSGSTSASNQLFVTSTGTTIYSSGTLQSRKRLKYRVGQGVIARLSCYFSAPVANSYQLVGLGHAEDGIYFGYGNTSNLSDTSFGILYVRGGKREIRTLTITTASSTTESITITLNGTANSIPVTNSGNIQRTVWEISVGTYAGWSAYPSGATIVFINNSAGVASGTYSITGTTVVGSFAQTRAGAASTDTFIPQSSWNIDPVDGTGYSGITLDPSKGNVYQIFLRDMGFGAFTFAIEAVTHLHSTWIFVHTISNPNSRTDTTFTIPSFPASIITYSAGSTTNLNTYCSSFSGFIEGTKIMNGNRFTYTRISAGIGTSPTYQTLFTVYNKNYFGGKVNQGVVNILSIQFAFRNSNSGGTIYLIRNASLVGNPNFADYDSTSCTQYDTSATSCTIVNNRQIIWSGILADTGNITHDFKQEDDTITLQPGEWITVAGNTTASTASVFSATLNTREDI
ncbi:membrane associated protein [Bodo saltans virus]|uniref:Membrane associated protein n=1 Tax=Bodo saltans virus TaxID=2024608 RepID=A0A2H4UVI4_9VIRU|nr:membrane associated protein [Bodo saltans virus]ATZ80938.1 membrane associated protein [Bodo saltans virus]